MLCGFILGVSLTAEEINSRRIYVRVDKIIVMLLTDSPKSPALWLSGLNDNWLSCQSLTVDLGLEGVIETLIGEGCTSCFKHPKSGR